MRAEEEEEEQQQHEAREDQQQAWARRRLEAAMRTMLGEEDEEDSEAEGSLPRPPLATAEAAEEEASAAKEEKEEAEQRAFLSLLPAVGEGKRKRQAPAPAATGLLAAMRTEEAQEENPALAPEPTLTRAQRKKQAAKRKRKAASAADAKSNEPATTSPKPDALSAPEPQVIVFHPTSGRAVAAEDPASHAAAPTPGQSSYKNFMSSKVSKITGSTDRSRRLAPPLTEAEQVQEEDLRRKDAELQELLSATRLVEEFHADELMGAERRRWREARLVELGAKAPKPAKMPLPLARVMAERRKAKAAKELEEAKNTGMLTDSLRARIQVRIRGGKPASGNGAGNKRKRDKGLHGSVGHYSNGTLTVPQHVIRQVEAVKQTRGGGGAKRKRTSRS